jgi:hypothetical protein
MLPELRRARLHRWIVPATLAVGLGGCGAIGAIGLPMGRDRAPAQPQDLTMAAPSQPVETRALPPVAEMPPPEAGYDEGPRADLNNPQTADLLADPGDPSGEPVPARAANPQLAANAPDVGRTDLLGGWTVTSSGDTCQLFMTLTSWTGGYRASTKGCSSEALSSISAWNLDGKQVVLSSAAGTPVARLYSAGGARFDGQTDTGGAPISFFR